TFVGQGEVADDVVVKGLDAGPVVADVVGSPPASEFVAAGGEFADEVLEVFVMWISTGFGAQDCNADVGGPVPVRVELVGGAVEREGGRDRVEDGGGDTGKGAALERGVVLDAHPRERGNLTAAQSGDASRTHVGQACLLGGDLGSPREEELADLRTVINVNT